MNDRCRCGQPSNTTHCCDPKDLVINALESANADLQRRLDEAERQLVKERLRIESLRYAMTNRATDYKERTEP